jgi:Domain of unknown function (DUF4062)
MSLSRPSEGLPCRSIGMKAVATVMVSSTFLDLPIHRDKAIEACQRLGFNAEAMEFSTAADRTTLTKSMKMVAEADIYILLLGFRYGTIPDGKDESLTVLEFRRARQLGVPCLVFCMSDEHTVTPADVETGPGAEKLGLFKEEVRKTGLVTAFFSSAEQLMTLVIQSLAEERERVSHDKGEKKSIIPRPPTQWAVHPYTLMQTNSLIGRHRELTILESWTNNTGFPILVLHAIGGMGKSAVTWSWFRNQADSATSVFQGSFWWSFYEASAGFDNFVLNALAYTTGRTSAYLNKLSYAKRLDLLRLTLDADSFLIVLDGFERELNAYARFDVTRINDDPTASADQNSNSPAVDWTRRGRNTFDTRVGEFLRKLSVTGKSKILISSRIVPADLEGETGLPLPGIIETELKGLNVAEASELWNSLGVRGTKAALSRLFESIQGYPLLVRAMAGQVINFRPAPGDFDAWERAHPSFNPYQIELKQRKTLILEHALRGIDAKTWQVLSTIAALRMPAQYGFLVAVLVGGRKICADEEMLIQSLEELESRGLVGWNRVKNNYDLHPTVRNVVWTKVTTADRRDLYSAMQKEFEAMPGIESDDAKTEDDLFVPIELVRVLIEQELYNEAFAIYSARLDDPLHRLGLFDRQRELLSPMFLGYESNGEVTSRLNEVYSETASLRLAYVLDDGANTKAALKLMQFHNKTCQSETCRLHQLRVFLAEGRQNTGETIIQSLLRGIRKQPTKYEPQSEFYCLYFLAQCLMDRNEVSLAQITIGRLRSIAKTFSPFTIETEFRRNRLQRWDLDLEYDYLMLKKEFNAAAAASTKGIQLAKKNKDEIWLSGATRNRFYALLRGGRIEDAIVDLRLLFELSTSIGGLSATIAAERAQVALLLEQARLDEARSQIDSLESRFGSVLDVSSTTRLLHLKGKVAVASADSVGVVKVAEQILELLCGTRDYPRGGDITEWAISELNMRAPDLVNSFKFPAALNWNPGLIDPAFKRPQTLN